VAKAPALAKERQELARFAQAKERREPARFP